MELIHHTRFSDEETDGCSQDSGGYVSDYETHYDVEEKNESKEDILCFKDIENQIENVLLDFERTDIKEIELSEEGDFDDCKCVYVQQAEPCIPTYYCSCRFSSNCMWHSNNNNQ